MYKCSDSKISELSPKGLILLIVISMLWLGMTGAVIALVNDVSSVSLGVSPGLVNVSEEVSFSVTWGGLDYGVFFCKNSDCSGCNSADQEECYCYDDLAQSSPFNCNYTALHSDRSANNYYYVMFYNSTDNSYSAIYYSTDSFDVNHKPYAMNIIITPEYANESSVLNCTYAFYDPDDDSEVSTGRTFVWYRDVGSGWTQIGAQTSQTLENGASIHFNKSNRIMCGVAVQDEHLLIGDYVNSSAVTIIGENAPTVVAAGSTPDGRIDERDYVTFNVNWTDQDINDHPGGERAKIMVCNDTSFDMISLRCNNTVFCESGYSALTSRSCSYQITGDETDDPDGSVEYYVFVIDDGQRFNVSGQQIFYINHAPDIERIRLMPYGHEYYQTLLPFNCTDVSHMSSTAGFGENSNDLAAYYGVSASSVGSVLGYIDSLNTFTDGGSSIATSVLSLGMDFGYAGEQLVSVVTDSGTIQVQLPSFTPSQGDYEWRLYVASDGSTYYRTESTGMNVSYIDAFNAEYFAGGLFRDNDNILCNLTGVVDLDNPGNNHNISYIITWHLNRSGSMATYSAPDWPLITHGNTQPGDRWFCNVTVSDGRASSLPYYSDTITIMNEDGTGGMAPYLVSYSVSSESSNPDSVGDEVTFTVIWDDDNDPNEEVQIYICNSSYIDRTGCYDHEFAQSGWTTSKEVELKYVVRDADSTIMPFWILVCDDTGADENNIGGNWLCSNYPTFNEMGNITINHQPSLNRSVILNWSSYPLEPTEYDNLYCGNLNTSDNGDVFDADGDNITLKYRWYVQRGGIWSRFDVPVNTRVLANGNVLTGDMWKCEITPYDYFSAGNSMNSSAIHVWQANWSIPVIDSISDDSHYLSPTLVGDPVNFEVQWSDADGDGVKLYICNSSAILETGCQDGIFYESSTFSYSDLEVSYTVRESDLGLMNYFARVCDNSGEIWVCSDLRSGSFVVNHKPSMKKMSIATRHARPYLINNITDVSTTVSISGIPINNMIFFYYNVSLSIAPENFSRFGVLDPDTHLFSYLDDAPAKFPLVLGGNGSIIRQNLTISTGSDLEPDLIITLPSINVSEGVMWYMYVSDEGALYFANGSNTFSDAFPSKGVSLEYADALAQEYLFMMAPSAKETSNLLCHVEHEDIDGQMVIASYSWYLDRGDGFQKYLAPNTNLLTHGNIKLGDRWYCTAKLNDGFVTSDEVASEIIDISLIDNSGRPTIFSVLDDVNPPKRIDVGGQVNFSVLWSDPDSDQVNIYICNSTSIGKLGCLDGAGNPDNTSALYETHIPTSDNPITGSYTVRSEDSGTVDYYVMICDVTGGSGGDWKCSDIFKTDSDDSQSSSGNFTVNHKPDVLTDVKIDVYGTSTYFNENTSMICNVTPEDVDGQGVLSGFDEDGDTVYVYYNWYFDRYGQYQKLSFSGSRYLSHTQVMTGDTWMCEAVISDEFGKGLAMNSSPVSITRLNPGNSTPEIKSLIHTSNFTNPVNIGSDLDIELMIFDNDSLEFTFYMCNESYGVDISKAKGGCSNFGAYEFIQEDFSRTDFATYLYSPKTFGWTADGEMTNVTYYAWVCDHAPDIIDWRCSPPVQGSIILNQRPSAENITLAPANATSDIRCIYNYTSKNDAQIFDDIENDSMFSWYRIVNSTGSLDIINVNRANLNNTDAQYFRKNDRVWCEVKVGDRYGLFDSEFRNSSVIVIGDAYPEPNVSISPDMPGFNENLICSVDINDPDDDAYNITYRWFDQDASQPWPGYDSNILLKGYNTPSHRNWTCAVNLTRGMLLFGANRTVVVNQSIVQVINTTNTSVLNITRIWTVNSSYKIGRNVTIFADWTGWDNTTSVMWYVCNSSSISRYGCLDSFICQPPSLFTEDNPLACTFNTSIYQNVTTYYHSMICDFFGNCSAIVSNKIHLSYKIIIPDPVVENVTISPVSPNLSSSLACEYDFRGFGYLEDADMTEYAWYIYNNLTSGYDLLPYGSVTINNTLEPDGLFEIGDTLMCSIKAYNVNGSNSSFVNSSDVTINGDVHKYSITSMIDADGPLTFIFQSPYGTYSFSSDVDQSVSFYGQEIFNLTIINQDSSFMALISDLNISEGPIDIHAEYLPFLDLYANSTLDLAVDKSERYLITHAYAFYVDIENITIAYNYTGIDNITDSGDARVWKFDFDHLFSHSHDPQTVEYLDTTLVGDWLYAQVSDLSLFMLLKDQATPEICGNGIDDDYDGAIDEGCNVPQPSGGGRRSSRSSPVIIFHEPEENCSDNILNQGETGVDCGGPCDPCPVLLPPTVVRPDATCYDGILNQGETGIDCGGPCRACDYCSDGILNYGETGVDCGGPCRPCASCSDGIRNQGETGVDCGGPCPVCSPTCSDNIKNQDETGVDCGGSCKPCPVLEEPKSKGNILPFVIMLILLFVALAAYIFKDTMKKSFPDKNQSERSEFLNSHMFKPLPKEITHLEKPDNTLPETSDNVSEIKTSADALDEQKIIPPLINTVEYKEEYSLNDLGLRPQERLNLEKYVYHELSRGFSEIEIKDSLFRNGWPTLPIESLFTRIRNLDDVMQRHDLHTPHQNFEALLSSLQGLFDQLWEEGYREEEIESLMLSKGWPKKTIKKAFEYLLRTYNNQFMNN